MIHHSELTDHKNLGKYTLRYAHFEDEFTETKRK